MRLFLPMFWETLEKLNGAVFKEASQPDVISDSSGDIQEVKVRAPELTEKEIIIRDNQKGVSYKKLFGDFLKGATQITLTYHKYKYHLYPGGKFLLLR